MFIVREDDIVEKDGSGMGGRVRDTETVSLVWFIRRGTLKV